MSLYPQVNQLFDPQRPITRETINQVVELDALPPACFNLQPWNLLILSDMEDIHDNFWIVLLIAVGYP